MLLQLQPALAHAWLSVPPPPPQQLLLLLQAAGSISVASASTAALQPQQPAPHDRPSAASNAESEDMGPASAAAAAAARGAAPRSMSLWSCLNAASHAAAAQTRWLARHAAITDLGPAASAAGHSPGPSPSVRRAAASVACWLARSATDAISFRGGGPVR